MADRLGTVQESDAPDRSALSVDLDRQLAELADTLTWLADDLEAGCDVRSTEVRRLTERTAAAVDGLRFSRIVEQLGD